MLAVVASGPRRVMGVALPVGRVSVVQTFWNVPHCLWNEKSTSFAGIRKGAKSLAATLTLDTRHHSVS